MIIYLCYCLITTTITFTPVTPYVIKRVEENPKLQNYDLSSIVRFATGSAPISGETLLSLQKKYAHKYDD
ncbi:hypothetical protein SK128_003409 [Halocaridina rubra]|uniref:Uncharacterized protein n=1 Tax=Halocaridina rubra TaxID=373956 RepID=A0AAN8XQC0_HALRR